MPLLLYFFASCFFIKPELVVSIKSIIVKNDSTFVEIIFENKGEEDLSLYKPSLDDIDYGIFKIFAYSISDTTKKYELLSSTNAIQLNSIQLNRENTIILSQHTTVKTMIKFSNYNYLPVIKRGIYNMVIELNYEDIEFDGCFVNVFNKNIKTNFVQFNVE